MKFGIRPSFSGLFIIIVCIVSLVSCGKKGDPTLRSFEKPPPVTDIRVMHREDEIIISWDYPSSERDNIKGFYIERAEGTPNFTAPPLTFLKNDVSRYIDKEFKLKTEYFYKIRVYSLRDVISADSPLIKVRPLPLYGLPTGLSYVLTNEALKIQWDHLGDSIRYNVYKSLEKGKYSVTPLNSAPLKDNFIDDRVNINKPVYYTVRALQGTAVRDEGYPSAELEVNPGSFVPSGPSGLKYAIGDKKIYLMWNENKEAWLKGYRVYRKRTSDPEFVLAGEAVTPAFADNEPLKPNTSYYVTALGPEKESIASETIVVPAAD